ncbi:MAG: DUF2079 domain-containing protein [Rubrobacter sp.]|nr:DUF2079 domain-containing protein [Rubrobacter sp.]
MKGVKLRYGKSLGFPEIPKKRRRFGPKEFVLLSAVLYMVVLGALSVYKHETYASSRFDLGNMDQAVWNSAQGRILEATDETGEITSRLRNHADFLLLAFVPLYWVHASPHWLLVVQAVVVGLGALPLYWLARRFLGGITGRDHSWPAALVAAAYLLNPGLQAANLFDFHAQTMAGTLLLFAFHYLLERRLLPFALFAVLAALAKEEIVLLVAMMGLYAVFPLRRPRWGIPIFVLGCLYFLFVMLVAIPAYNPGDTSSLVEGRYETLGGSMGGVALTALTEPLFTLSYILSASKVSYLFSLVGPTGFLAVLSPLVLLIPLPELAINFLSERPQMLSIRYHYSTPILPFVYLAAAAGIANLVWLLPKLRGLRRPLGWLGALSPSEKVLRALPGVLAFLVLLLGVQTNYDKGPLPVFNAPGNNFSVIDPPPEEHLEALDEAVALIPDDARVSASNQIGPHLAHRPYLYLFPTVRDADYVIVDETEPAYDTAISPILNLQSTREVREREDYTEVYSRDGVVVFERSG